MPTCEYEGLKIEVDEEGYLLNFDDWNEKVACALAEREGGQPRMPAKDGANGNFEIHPGLL
jgi:sulfur relay (sulfurtransferase) DsrC/TusE family protein